MKNFSRNPILAFGSLLLAAVWLFTATAQAASPGAAQVKKVVGTASYTDAKGGGPLKEGDILFQGASITTGAGSYVDLFLGVNGDSLRIEADSTLSLNKLDYTTISGLETVVNTELDVKKGATVANVVNKLSKASKYEIKTPAGVAGIRGTALRVTTSRVVCLIGKVEFRAINGQLHLVMGGKAFAVGSAAPVKATQAETVSVAVVAAACAANTQRANTVSQIVKQFATIAASEAAAEAGVAGASQAASDTAKAMVAALIAAVNEAADSAPPSIRAAAQAAAADLSKRSDAIQASSAADGAALGTLAAGGTLAQAKSNSGAAADKSTDNKDNAQKAKTGGEKAADDGAKIKNSGGNPADISNQGSENSSGGKKDGGKDGPKDGGNGPPLVKPPDPFVSPK